MKVLIGHRLFLAVLLSVVAVAIAGVALTRWTLFDTATDPPSVNEARFLDGVAAALGARYRRHHDWSFLPADPAARKAWLRDAFQRAQQPARHESDGRPSPTLAYRIGLLDTDGRYLAGVIADPLVVAFASVDTIRRPVVVDQRAIGQLVVAKARNPDDALVVAFLANRQRDLLGVLAASVLLSALVAVLLAAHFRKPIRQLVDGARRLEDGQFDARLGSRRSDELGELAGTFDHLAARLEAVERSRRQWVADTSHELRTPLSVLRAQLEALQDGVMAATPDTIATLLRQVLSLTRRVDELYELARADIGQLHYDTSDHDLWLLVDETVRGFSEKFRAAGLVVALGSAPARSIVHCDAERMRQVVANLLENCVRYTAAGGRVAVGCTIDGDALHVTIDDSAPGVPDEAIGRLGERFFRVASSRVREHGGAGLGLALSRHIIQAHGGRLDFAPSPLGGLRATLALTLGGTR